MKKYVSLFLLVFALQAMNVYGQVRKQIGQANSGRIHETLASSGDFTLKIIDGQVWSWGNGGYTGNKQWKNPPNEYPGLVFNTDKSDYLKGVIAVANNLDFAMALTFSGIYYWGLTEEMKFLPVGNFTAIAQGVSHRLALSSTGNVSSQGTGFDGELGNGQTPGFQDNFEPVGSGGVYLSNIISIAAGSSTSYALDSHGDVWSWGYVYNPILMVYQKTVSPVKFPISNVIAISSTYKHILAVKADGSVWAWGTSAHGELGDGTQFGSSPLPVQVKGEKGKSYLKNIIAVSAGQYLSLALASDGTVYSWGTNYYGTLGIGSSAPALLYSPYPVRVKINKEGANLENVVAVSAGNDIATALLDDGSIFSWGKVQYDTYYANFPNDYTTLPIQVKEISELTSKASSISIASGNFHDLSLTAKGNLYAWGHNFYTQLGTGSGNNSERYPSVVLNDPTKALFSNVTAMSGGNSHSLALKSNGRVWAWGDRQFGQIGDNTSVVGNEPFPAQVKTISGSLTNIAAVASGGYHNLALTASGGIWSWGDNAYGALGLGNFGGINNLAMPITLGVLKNVIAISAGAHHSMALCSDGSVWSWGDNVYGQLGQGNSGVGTGKSSPVQVLGPGEAGFLNNIAAIACGQYSSYALTSDGQVYAWGKNDVGQSTLR